MGGKTLRLRNKVAVITGASLGIGSAIALALGKEGAAVAVDYRSHPDEAKQHDLPESALLALISEAYRWAPSSPRVLRTPTTR